MYTIFIPKYQGEKTEYLITKVIELYMKNSSCNCIISSPGYMSTTSNTIGLFVDELGNKMSEKQPYIGFFHGMNGGSTLRGKLPPNSKSTIREEYERRVDSSNTLELLPVCCDKISDHRKMMFFIKYNCDKPGLLDKKTCKNFLSQCTVYGVLIGSSNQSLQTYFGGRNSAPAEKGEAEVLMYTDDNDKKITNDLIEFQNDNIDIRISESIDKENYDDNKDKNFFKEILSNFLENNLI